MANPNRANGFRPVGTLAGTPWNARVRRYQAADRTADTTNNHGDIYVGDPVAFSSGLVVPANSGDVVLGVCVACGYNASTNDQGIGPYDPRDLTIRYSPLTDATANTYIWVAPAEGGIFEIQSASDLDLLVGATADHNVTAATTHGSRTTGKSNAQMVADTNDDLRIVEIPLYPDNDSTIANARYWVMFTNTTFGPTALSAS